MLLFMGDFGLVGSHEAGRPVSIQRTSQWSPFMETKSILTISVDLCGVWHRAFRVDYSNMTLYI